MTEQIELEWKRDFDRFENGRTVPYVEASIPAMDQIFVTVRCYPKTVKVAVEDYRNDASSGQRNMHDEWDVYVATAYIVFSAIKARAVLAFGNGTVFSVLSSFTGESFKFSQEQKIAMANSVAAQYTGRTMFEGAS